MRIAFAACAALLLATPAVAAEPPVPKMFRGISMDKGQWRMEILKAERAGGAPMGGPQAMTLCTDNVLKPRDKGTAHGSRPECKYRLLKDTSTEAVMESECPDSSDRVTLKREGEKSVLMQAEHQGRGGPSRMTMRYTYEGACREGQGAMSFDGGSEACKQMRSQAALMDPAKSCASAGAQRAACEERMRAAVEQMTAMCR